MKTQNKYQGFPIFQIQDWFIEKCRNNCSIKPTHIAIFYYLIFICRLKKTNRITVSSSEVKACINLTSDKTYSNCIKDLESLEILKYEKGKNQYKGAFIELLFPHSIIELIEKHNRCGASKVVDSEHTNNSINKINKKENKTHQAQTEHKLKINKWL